MTARQEIHKIGIESICRYNIIHVHLTAVVQKLGILREFIKKGCTDAAAARIAGRKISGTQRVFEIIQKSNNGLNPLIIRQVTGYSEQKTAKILYKLFKYGQIRIEPGGLYLAAAIR